MFFFFKQKTAYEMRISDWSSDVCSSDLRLRLDLEDRKIGLRIRADQRRLQLVAVREDHLDIVGALDHVVVGHDEAGRIDHEAGAERIDLLIAAAAVTLEEVVEEFLEGRSVRHLRRMRAGHLAVAILRGRYVAHLITQPTGDVSDRGGTVPTMQID